MRNFRFVGFVLLAPVLGAAIASAQPNWMTLKNPSPLAVGPLFQLRDGRILAHSDQDGNANSFYVLTPNATGSYQNGTWSGPYNLQPGYAPFYFSTGILTDGKTVIIEGGEYNNGQAVWTTLGAVGTLTPFGAITFTPNSAPSGWATIGDAQSSLLPNGRYFQANCCTRQTAIYNAPNSWTPAANVLANSNDEEAYTALPNGHVLMVDIGVNGNCGNSNKSTEYYDYTKDMWTCGPHMVTQLGQGELGSAVLTYTSSEHPQGSVIQFGGDVSATNVLDIASNTWIDGPTPPNGLEQPDGPAALEPNGKVLAMLSPGVFQSGCQFLEYDPVANTLAIALNSPQCPGDPSYIGHMMILPTGQIASVSFSSTVYLYNPDSGVVSGVAPTIVASSNFLAQGSKNNLIYGKQLNGLSENNAYGDDYQTPTDFPLIRFTDENGNVWYGWTHDDSDHSIAPGHLGSTKFDLNPAMPLGAYKMEVVTNGIASNAVNITVVSPHP